MAATLDQITAQNDNTNTGSTTVSVTIGGSNRYLLVHVTQDRNSVDPTVTGVTCDGVAMTQVEQGSTDFACRSSLWELVNPNAGTVNVVVTYSATQTQSRTIQVASWKDVNQATPRRTHSLFASATNAALFSNTYTNGQSGDLTADFLAVRSASSSSNLAADGGQSQQNASNNGLVVAGCSTEPGAASVTMGWTWTNDGTAMRQHFVALVGAAGGVPDPFVKVEFRAA